MRKTDNFRFEPEVRSSVTKIFIFSPSLDLIINLRPEKYDYRPSNAEKPIISGLDQKCVDV